MGSIKAGVIILILCAVGLVGSFIVIARIW